MQAQAGNNPASLNTGPDTAKTPTVRLFERFQSLTISTPGTDVGNSHGQQQHTADAGQKPRRSVAFGTPSMLTYTPARPLADPEPQPDATPLWSNAGQELC